MSPANICPDCGHQAEKAKKEWWMYLLPFSRYYQCPRCSHRYLRVLGIFYLCMFKQGQKDSS